MWEMAEQIPGLFEDSTRRKGFGGGNTAKLTDRTSFLVVRASPVQ